MTTISRQNFCAYCDKFNVIVSNGKHSRCGYQVFKNYAEYLTLSTRIEFCVPIRLVNDNEGRSQHWRKADKRKREYLDTLRKIGIYRTEVPAFKQRIVITRLLGKGERFWDADSVLRGSAKELIDCLKELKFFKDDSYTWLVDAHGKQDASSRSKGSAVKVELYKAL